MGESAGGFDGNKNATGTPSSTTEKCSAREPVKCSAKPEVEADSSTTKKRTFKWRIKINRRKAKKGYSYHWNYALWTGEKERIKYGGSLAKLMAMNPARWQKYQKNSRKRKRK